jgi:hypothetical protein
MSAFTPAGSGGIPLSITNDGGITSYSIDNIQVPTANTEVMITVPTTATWFHIFNRTDGLTKLAFASGMSGTTYITVNPGDGREYIKKNGTSMALYVQCPKGTQVLEVTYGHSS